MLKKRSWPYVIGTGVMLLALLLPGLLPKKEAGPTGEAVSYVLTFDAHHRRPEGLTETASNGYYDAMTDGGAVLHFAYEKAKALNDGFLTLSDGGTFRNPWSDTTDTLNRISGLMKIKAVFTGGSLSVSYGWEEDKGIEDGGAVLPLTSGEDYPFDARPSYFKIAASGETAIQSLVLTYSCHVSPKPLAASAGLTFTFDESTKTYAVTDYDDSAATVTVPRVYRASSTEDYYPVTAIGDQAFKDCFKLTSINLPDSIVTIGEKAFYNCYKLTSINLPDSIVTIGDQAFYLCKALASVTLSTHLETLGEWAFGRCSTLSSLILPDSLITIGTGAFAGCSTLSSMTLPANVQSIEGQAFQECTKLMTLNVDPANETYKSVGECIIKKDDGELVASCIGSTTIPAGQGITKIGKHAFYKRSDLTEITIPEGVTNIEFDAFAECSNLEKVTFPQTTAYSIGGNYAFAGCEKLKTVDFGANLSCIGFAAFQGCGFTSLVIPASVKTVKDWAFNRCEALEWLVLPKGLTQLGNSGLYYLFDSTDKIKCLYYSGTQEEWNNIPKYLGGPSTLIVAYYSEAEVASTTDTKYWHYAEGVPELWPEASAAA